MRNEDIMKSLIISLIVLSALAETFPTTAQAQTQAARHFDVADEPYNTNTTLDSDANALTSYTSDPQAVENLRAYVNEAAHILEECEARVRVLDGPAMYRRLYGDTVLALTRSYTFRRIDPRQEMLLFRVVLRRALSLSRIFINDPRDLSHTTRYNLELASSILLAGIRGARQYQALQPLGTNSQEVVANLGSVNFVNFAESHIESFLTLVGLAGSTQAQQQILIRALGWTRNSLIRLTNSRHYADPVSILEQAQSRIVAGTISTTEGQQQLFEARNQIRTLAGQPVAPAPRGIPILNSPGLSMSGEYVSPYERRRRAEATPRTPIHFPLHDPESRREAGSTYYGPYDSSWDGQLIVPAGAAVSLGGAPSFDVQSSVNGYAALHARANFIARSNWGSSDRYSRYMHNGLSGSIFATAGFNRDLPMLTIRADLQIAAIPFITAGPWVAIEANRFNQFSEVLIRAGVGIHPVIRLGDSDYIMVNLGWLPAAGQFAVPGRIGMGNATLSALLRRAAFFAYFVLGIDAYAPVGEALTGRANTLNNRLNLTTGMSIPVNFLVRGDALTLDFNMTRYERFPGYSEFPLQHPDGSYASLIGVTTVGAYYGFQF